VVARMPRGLTFSVNVISLGTDSSDAKTLRPISSAYAFRIDRQLDWLKRMRR